MTVTEDITAIIISVPAGSHITVVAGQLDRYCAAQADGTIRHQLTLDAATADEPGRPALAVIACPQHTAAGVITGADGVLDITISERED